MYEGTQTFFRKTVLEERDAAIILWFILIKKTRKAISSLINKKNVWIQKFSMIQNKIRRKFKCRNLGCSYESVSFSWHPSHTWDKQSDPNFLFQMWNFELHGGIHWSPRPSGACRAGALLAPWAGYGMPRRAAGPLAGSPRRDGFWGCRGGPRGGGGGGGGHAVLVLVSWGTLMLGGIFASPQMERALALSGEHGM